MTTYADLMTSARDHLAAALLRQRRPAALGPAPEMLPAHLGAAAAALAHLGDTLGRTGPGSVALHVSLRALAKAAPPLPPDLGPPDPRGATSSLAAATRSLRAAADLVVSHGPPVEEMTPRLQAHEWAGPRPAHLRTLPARRGVWTQLADLASLVAALPTATGDAPLAQQAARAAAAALTVHRHAPDQAMQATAPAWPLPLPRHQVPGEWAGRLQELTTLAWRMTLPLPPGRAHPVDGLRQIAETGHLLHTQAARQAGTPDQHSAHLAHAALWRDIHRQLHSIQTPTEPLMPDARVALARVRGLASTTLDPAELAAGCTALAEAASWGPAALARYIGNPDAGLGPRLSPELRAHLTGYRRTSLTDMHRYEQVLMTNLDETPARIPRGALDLVTPLYVAAAGPPGTRPDLPEPTPGTRRTPGPARTPAPGHRPTPPSRPRPASWTPTRSPR